MRFVKLTKGIDRKFKEDEFYGWRADCANEYIEGCVEILTDDEEFKKFRQNPKYTPVLAHVTTEQGVEYLKDIISNQPLLLNEIERFTSLNDKIGKPFVSDFSLGSGKPPDGMSFTIDPTTIRYIKVKQETIIST